VTGARLARHALPAVLLLGSAAPVPAQAWSVDLSAGHAAYDALPSRLSAAHLALALRYRTSSLWSYAMSAAPLGSTDPYWSAVGAGLRLGGERGRRRVGVEAAAHGYLFRDRVLDADGRGAVLEAGPFATAAWRGVDLDARAVYQHHLLDFDEAREGRGVVDALLRAGWGTPVRVLADARLVHAPDGSFPWLGATAVWQRDELRAWLAGGRWLHDSLDDVGWGVGASHVRGRYEAWAMFRQEPREPLFWNLSRRTWLVGLSRRIGSAPPAGGTIPVMRAGRVVLRLDAADAGRAPRVAGEFNDWQPTPMTRAGAYWEIELALPSGVYRYAFVAPDGTWFVPASVPGRMSDGMGGHVALLVVP
jgi:hypothetical protein